MIAELLAEFFTYLHDADTEYLGWYVEVSEDEGERRRFIDEFLQTSEAEPFIRDLRQLQEQAEAAARPGGLEDLYTCQRSCCKPT